MQNTISVALACSFIALASGQGCRSEAAPAPPATAPVPQPPAYPEPPPLTGDPSLCVERRFAGDDKAWEVKTYPYDAARRVVIGRIYFNGEGQMIKRLSSNGSERVSYDARGNVQEWSDWDGEQLDHGTRWQNRYEGEPPRLVAQEVSDFLKLNERNAPHTRMRYEYDAAGHVQVEQKDGPRGMALRMFTWRGERIVAIQGSLGPRRPTDHMPYDEGVTYEYDAQGRLSTLVVDGEMPYGEGATADGKPDHRATFHYDAAGNLERIERDGQGGDVSPEPPDGKLDEVVLLSPPCDAITRLAPWLFYLPQLNLPRSLAPPLR